MGGAIACQVKIRDALLNLHAGLASVSAAIVVCFMHHDSGGKRLERKKANSSGSGENPPHSFTLGAKVYQCKHRENYTISPGAV